MPIVQFTDTFATQAWLADAGSPTRVPLPVQPPSSQSLEISTTAALEYVYYNPFGGTPTRVVGGFFFRYNSLPGGDAQIAKLDMGPAEGRLIMQASGRPFIIVDGTPTMASVDLGRDLVANRWYWAELMADKSANPWEFRANIDGTVISTTGAAAASNCGSDFMLLGTNRTDTETVYLSYLKYGRAFGDSDWFGPPGDATNLIYNGTFDDDIAYWSATGTAAVSRSTAQRWVGPASMLVDCSADNDGCAYQTITDRILHPVSYRLSAYVYPTTSCELRIGFNELTEEGVYLSTQQTYWPGLRSQTWQQITRTGVMANANARQALVFVASSAPFADFYVDDVEWYFSPTAADVPSPPAGRGASW